MMFDEFHDGMGMMMGWNVDFWVFIVVGLIILVLITILILTLMNKSTRHEINPIHINNTTPEISGEIDTKREFVKFCSGCGAQLTDNYGKYCPICGIQVDK